MLLTASVGCGHCDACGRGVVFRCANPAEAGVYGVGHALGGCQAELVAVPAADMNLVALPPEMTDDTGLVLTDSAPTGWYGARLARIAPGDTVAVVGLGPWAYGVAAARIMGAARVLGVDLAPERRARAAALGGEPVGDDPAADVLRLTGGRLADVVVEAVGATPPSSWRWAWPVGAGGCRSSASTRNPAFAFNMLMAQLICAFTIGLCSVQHELPALLALTEGGRLDPAWSSRTTYRWRRGGGLRAVRRPGDGVSKVVLDVA